MDTVQTSSISQDNKEEAIQLDIASSTVERPKRTLLAGLLLGKLLARSGHYHHGHRYDHYHGG